MSKFTHTAESRPLEGYTIKRPLHRGGFGEVYFAVSDGGRDVALKLLQHNVDVELRGVQQCLNLSHPNLVTIFDVRQDGDGDYWIVMEYVPGETLDELLRRENRPLPMQEVLRWMRGLCAGVTYMHERGIVHRDLKPSNIFGADGTVKIGDIGLSKFITASRRSAHTESVGTVYYMAPEIARGRYGNEVDIYAIGIIAYELLSGNVPFDGESAGEILMKHLTQPPNLKALPERLRAVIQRALAKDPHQRQQSASAFLKEFEAAVVGRLESASSQPVVEVAEQDRGTERVPSESEYSFGGWLFPYPGRLFGIVSLLLALGILIPLHGLTILAVVLVGMSFINFHRARGAGRFVGGLTRHFKTDCDSPSWKPKAPHALDRNNRKELMSQNVLLRNQPNRAPMMRAEPAPWYGHWLILVLIQIPILVALRSGTNPLWVALLTGLACVVLALTTKTLQFGAELLRNVSGPATGAVRAPIHQTVLNSPLLPIRVPRERAASLTTSVFIAPLFVTVLTGTMSVIQPTLFDLHSGSLSMATLFVAVATVGTWMLSFISTLAEGKDWDKWTRRGMFGAGGLVTGAAAYGVWALLFSPKSTLLNTDSQRALFRHFGSHLLANDHAPTLAGFLCFFGFLFALVNWNKHTGLYRAARFRVGPVLESLLAAWLVTRVLVFPSHLACLWVGVISAAAQLASPWMAKAKV